MAGKKRRRKTHAVLKTLLTLVLLAGALAGIWFYRERKNQEKDERQNAMLITQDTTALVTRETIRQTTEGSGILEAAKEITVVAEDTVRIDTVEAEAGDVVEKGDVIARINLDSIDEQIDTLEGRKQEINNAISASSKSGYSSLESPVSGRIRRIFAKEGDLLADVVLREGGVMEIAAAGQLKVAFKPDQDISVGMDVSVRFENDEEEYTADGIVTQIDDGIAEAVFDDDADYDVDLAARIFDEDEHLLGEGTIESRHPYLVEGAYGRVDEINVSLGEWVDRGAKLLSRTEVAYNADYLHLLSEREDVVEDLMHFRRLKEHPVISARQAGILSSVGLQEYTVVTENTPVYTLMLTDRYQIKAQIDELDIDGVKAGQDASVVFDAFDDREYTGKVTRVSSLGQNVNGVTTYPVTIDLEGREEFKNAMSATATIVTREEENALVIPVDALQTKDEKKVVTVLSGEDLSFSEDREVTVGIVNHTMAQITEGLSEGETVLVIGTSQIEEMINMMRASRRSSGRGEG